MFARKERKVKKYSKLVIAAVLMAAVGFVAPHVGALGHVVANEKGEVKIDATQVIDSTAYMAGERVVVGGTIKGDLFCAGNDIVVNGTVEGDVLCAGTNLTIGGTVHGDVRAAGNVVTLKAQVGGSASLAGNTVTIDKGAIVQRDITGGASTLNLDGTVKRDMLLGTGVMNFGGTVGRDVHASISSLSVRNEAKVGGNFIYQSEKQQNLPAGVVAGQTNFTERTDQTAADGSWIKATLWTIVSFIVLALGVTLLVPKYLHEASSVSVRTVMLAFLVGFAALLLLPFASILVMATIVGIPLGMVGMLVWLIMACVSSVFTAYYIGGLILRKRATNALLVVLVGALVVGLLMLIPGINVLVFIITLCVGMGLQAMHIRHQFSKRPYTILAD